MSATGILACVLALLAVPAAAAADGRTDPRAPAGADAVVRLHAPPADWAALAGRRVRIEAPLTLTAPAHGGELAVAFGGRLWQPRERAAPGSAEHMRLEADNARRRLWLDRGSAGPAGCRADAMLRAGSTAATAEGVVEARPGGGWRLRLTAPAQVRPATRPAAPQVAGALKIAALNLENLFNGDGRGDGFPTPRGARTPAALRMQLAKLTATLRALDPDLVALMELENDGYGADSSLAQLVDALNAGGGGDWRFVDAGEGPGRDAIRVGLIYRVGKLTPLGAPATLQGGPFGDASRAPLAQAFRRGDGPAFVVVANHFKSKGCRDAEGADADRGDGQACWNALRLESARRLDAWLRADPTGQGAERILLLGDLNAYAMEDPLRWLRHAGWTDAFAAAGVERPYSYVYDGRAGRLDHALLSPGLVPHLKGAAEWHSNADEPDAAGYAECDVPGPWRSSDHDPLLLGFDL